MHAASIKEDSAQGCDVHYRTGSTSPVLRARLIGKNAEKLKRQHTAAMCRECVFIHMQPPRQGPAIFTYATGLSSLETVLNFSRLQICWQGGLKQLFIERRNADTKHLDASRSVIHLLLKRLVRVLKKLLIFMATVFIPWCRTRPPVDQSSILKQGTTQDHSKFFRDKRRAMGARDSRKRFFLCDFCTIFVGFFLHCFGQFSGVAFQEPHAATQAE